MVALPDIAGYRPKIGIYKISPESSLGRWGAVKGARSRKHPKQGLEWERLGEAR